MFNKYSLTKWMKGFFHCKLWGSSPWAEIIVETLTFICRLNILFLSSQALKVRAHTQIIHSASGSCVTFLWWQYQYTVVLVILSFGHQMAEVTRRKPLFLALGHPLQDLTLNPNYPFSTINSPRPCYYGIVSFCRKVSPTHLASFAYKKEGFKYNGKSPGLSIWTTAHWPFVPFEYVSPSVKWESQPCLL